MLLVSVVQAAAAPHTHTNDRSIVVGSNGSAKTRGRTVRIPSPDSDDIQVDFNYNPNYSSSPENMPGGELKASGSLPGRYSASSSRRTSPDKEPSKKWTFGGLFRRKEKSSTSTSEKGKVPLQPSASVPITIQFEPSQRPASTNSNAAAAARPRPQSASDDSSSESASSLDAPKQNFISRKLSKGKGQRSKKGSTSGKNGKGFDVPDHPGTGRPLNGKFAHVNQERPPSQIWEITKKPALLVPPNSHGMNNYSSSGSLSLSVDGSSLSRGSRAAAREATKARAAARRESYLEDTSSSSGDEGADGGSFQGSHSSLSSRTRKQVQALKRKSGNGVLNSSPNLNPVGLGYQSSAHAHAPAPGSSPRWEARVIYTKETLGENDEPIIVKLPKTESVNFNGNGKYISQHERTDGQVITAGLKVPLLVAPNNNPEPVYANLPLKGLPMESSATPPPPPPPRRDFPAQTTPTSFRPMSMSYLDSYNHNTNLNQIGGNTDDRSRKSHHFQPESILDYESEPRRRVASSPVQKVDQVPKVNGHDTPASSYHGYSMSMNPNGEPQPRTVSKLGFPVRKLDGHSQPGNDSNLPASSGPSPVHQRASAFWRRQEIENGHIRHPSSMSPSPNFSKQFTRIRSADSSPSPLPKFSKTGNHQNSDSVRSTSSHSGEIPSPSPNTLISGKYTSGKIQAGPLKSRNLKSPDFKITSPTPNGGKENPAGGKAASACERLAVAAIVRGRGSPSPAATVTSSASSPRPRPGIIKTPKKNLEEALNELEDMYKSLRLSDEDLLDRAERRDLPTAHQELRDKDPVQISRFFRFTPPGSLESLPTSGSGGSSENSRFSRPRQRAPPMRRSCRPDLINDDMAKRKYVDDVEHKANDPRDVVAAGGSYLVLSPAFSPPSSPCPPDNYPYQFNPNDPDIVIDDVTVRNFKKANAIKIIEPQPPFGIPLGPVTPAPASDYLHSQPTEKFRPLYRHVKNPDIVKDDLGFRNLRKDLNQENNLSKDWTPRLFSPLRREGDGFNFNLNIPPTAGEAGSKKLRAIRSLSANISNLIPTTTSSPFHNAFGKWNSYSELHSRSSRSVTPVNYRASTYPDPSWVEQAELEYYDELEFGKDWGNFNANGLRPKPKVTRSAGAEFPSSDKPRRPWTDIILESFEKEKENELDPSTGPASQLEKTEKSHRYSMNDNEEDEVFMDASEITPRESPLTTAMATARDFSTPKSEILATGTRSNGHPQQYSHYNNKNRRGSWVEPKSSVSSKESASEETKRKSWSDVPVHYQAVNFSSPSQEFLSAANPGNLHFTPLPPPRRVKQINLDGFSPNSSFAETSSLVKVCREYQAECLNPPLTVKTPSRSELELNDLIDALVREADTCGPPPTLGSNNEIPSSVEVELESAPKFESAVTVHGKSGLDADVGKPSSSVDSISDLIESINQSLPKSAVDVQDSRKPVDDDLELDVDTLQHFPGSMAGRIDVEPLRSKNLEKLQDVDASKTVGGVGESKQQKVEDRDGSMSKPQPRPRTGPGPSVADGDLRKGPQQSDSHSSPPSTTAGSGKKTQGIEHSPEMSGPRSIGKINCHPKSAFEVHIKPLRDVSGSPEFSGITKGSLPVWRVPQIKTSGLKALDQAKSKQFRSKSSSAEGPVEEKLQSSNSFQPWKKNLVSKQQTTKSKSPKSLTSLDKLSSSSSESEKKEPQSSTIQSSYKRDSFSDAEGMSGLKRLLRKETVDSSILNQGTKGNQFLPNPSLGSIGGIKKSPSAGSTSYWSRISSGQPSFLKKFFEKPNPSSNSKAEAELDVTSPCAEDSIETKGKLDSSKSTPMTDLPEPVLSLNVAQKATMFMKLEHDQRFSKWHNSPPVEKEGRPRSTRFSTQPVTSEELFSAAKALDDSIQPNEKSLHSNAMDSSDKLVQPGVMSSSADVDDVLLHQGNAMLEPSRLSLKDRVNYFNRMSTVPMAIVQSRPASSRPNGFGLNSQLNDYTRNGYTNTGGLISKSLNNDTDSSYDNLSGFGSDYAKNLKRRRGSDSSLVGIPNTQVVKGNAVPTTMPNTGSVLTKTPPAMIRNAKTKSLFLSQFSSDPDNLSEDGEISSGGQEVAEIISRSFENSPIFRKKSWRAQQQQPQPSFAKELWRKFGKPDEDIRQWSAINKQGLSDREINPITSPIFPKLVKGPPAAPTATSNLLPILTALSSSDDQLSEASKFSNAPPVKPRRSHLRKILNQKSEPPSQNISNPRDSNLSSRITDGGHTSLHVTSKQKLQAAGESYSALSDTNVTNAQFNSTEEMGFSSVKREGELLVMKKHMPIVRRKSSGKSKNPLKVLAARMDFRNQKYTETLLDDGNDATPQ